MQSVAKPLLGEGKAKVLNLVVVCDGIAAPQARVLVRGLERHVVVRKGVLASHAGKGRRQVLRPAKVAVPGANKLSTTPVTQRMSACVSLCVRVCE